MGAACAVTLVLQSAAHYQSTGTSRYAGVQVCLVRCVSPGRCVVGYLGWGGGQQASVMCCCQRQSCPRHGTVGWCWWVVLGRYSRYPWCWVAGCAGGNAGGDGESPGDHGIMRGAEEAVSFAVQPRAGTCSQWGMPSCICSCTSVESPAGDPVRATKPPEQPT